MKKTEMEDIVFKECNLHSLCLENGVCPFYDKGKCLMIQIPKIPSDES